MRIHYLIHADFEEIGYIATWAKERGHQLNCCRTFQGDMLPDVEDFDFLVIMGGPQSINELEKYPYLRDEINLLLKSIDQKKLLLGVCLGAQMISKALGGHAVKSPEKEVGVYPIELTKEGMKDPLFQDFPKTFNVFHWHYDMAGEFEGIRILAKSEGCPVQVFRYKHNVYGLQCHFEFDEDKVQEIIDNCPHDLSMSRYTQAPKKMFLENFLIINQRMALLLDHMVQSYIKN